MKSSNIYTSPRGTQGFAPDQEKYEVIEQELQYNNHSMTGNNWREIVDETRQISIINIFNYFWIYIGEAQCWPLSLRKVDDLYLPVNVVCWLCSPRHRVRFSGRRGPRDYRCLDLIQVYGRNTSLWLRRQYEA